MYKYVSYLYSSRIDKLKNEVENLVYIYKTNVCLFITKRREIRTSACAQNDLVLQPTASVLIMKLCLRPPKYY